MKKFNELVNRRLVKSNRELANVETAKPLPPFIPFSIAYATVNHRFYVISKFRKRRKNIQKWRKMYMTLISPTHNGSKKSGARMR